MCCYRCRNLPGDALSDSKLQITDEVSMNKPKRILVGQVTLKVVISLFKNVVKLLNLTLQSEGQKLINWILLLTRLRYNKG